MGASTRMWALCATLLLLTGQAVVLADDVITSSPKLATPEDKQKHIEEVEEAMKAWKEKMPWYAGFATDGEIYHSASLAWIKLLEQGNEQWYNKSVEFWAKEPPTLQGIMSGYDHLHEADIRDSKKLIRDTFKKLRGKSWLKSHGKHLKAIDVAAGVGRTAISLLLPLFGEVELTDPVAAFIDKAKEEIEAKKADFPDRNASTFYTYPLQDFPFSKEKSYDVYWIQWCLLYLSDSDVLDSLRRIRATLPEGGMVFIKENVASYGFVVDKQAASMTRSQELLERLFQAAEFKTVIHRVQKGFDPGLFEVHMWALQGRDDKGSSKCPQFLNMALDAEAKMKKDEL